MTNESIPAVQSAVKESLEVSQHRRAVQMKQWRAWRRRMLLLGIPAVAGAALLVHQTMQWTPIPALILVGVVLVLPFLVAIGERP